MSSRTQQAAAIIRDVLKPAPKDPKTGNTQIFLSLDAPKDEGDFGMYDLMLGTLGAMMIESGKVLAIYGVAVLGFATWVSCETYPGSLAEPRDARPKAAAPLRTSARDRIPRVP